MNLFEKIVYALSFKITTPVAYGWFHIMCLILTATISVFVALKLKDADDKKINRFLLIMSVIMLSFEVYKQTVFSFNYNDGIVTWDYQWYAFPFQFCSTPMYIAFIA